LQENSRSYIINASTVSNMWAWMCPSYHILNGKYNEFGIGMGQKFENLKIKKMERKLKVKNKQLYNL